MRRAYLGFFLGAVLALAACQSNGGPSSSPSESATPTASNQPCPAASVPQEQAGIYATQSAWLDSYRETVSAHAPGEESHPTFGGHLLTADSNRGAVLLQPDAMSWVNLSLGRFQELGIEGVTLNIGYPILMPTFPDSDKYLTYYTQVAAAVRQHGMSLAVEQIVLYTGSQFSPFDFKFDGLTLEKYTLDQTAMAQIIIDNLSPDYLTVMHEPDTVAELTGLTSMLDPAVATSYVNDVLAGLHRGETLVGAGSGSWSGPQFAESFAKNTVVDYIEVHIYWINPFSVEAAYAMAEAAKDQGKPVVITEAGLYKTTGAGLEGTANVDGVAAVYRRDVFSFWQPLDMSFLDITGAFARTIDTLYISAYWTNMFFSYIDWTSETSGMSYQQLNAERSALETALAWQADRFTCAGGEYQAVIAASR